MVTQQEIDEAEVAVEQAESKLDTAEAHHERAGSERSVDELRAARGFAHAARDRLRQLKGRWAVEQAGQARRAEAEAKFTKKRGTVTKNLTAARDEAAAAVAALDAAVEAALQKVGAYSALVQQTSGELTAAGLRAGDGGVDGGATGGTVHLDDEVWRPVDGVEVLAHTLTSAVAAVAPRHPFAGLRHGTGSLAAKVAREALMSGAVR